MRDMNGNTGNSNRGNNNTTDGDDNDDTGFGDTMGSINENHLRIGFQNIGGLSSNNTETDKILQTSYKATPLTFLGSAKSTSSGQHCRKNYNLQNE
jgi:hypothetical protein